MKKSYMQIRKISLENSSIHLKNIAFVNFEFFNFMNSQINFANETSKFAESSWEVPWGIKERLVAYVLL